MADLRVQGAAAEDRLGGLDQPGRRSPPGTMLFGALRPVALLDLRDDPARPRSGILLQLGGDYQRSFSGSETAVAGTVHVNLFKVQGLVAAYLPLPSLASIVFSARAGRVFQLDDASLTPGDRRFYLGGAPPPRGVHEGGPQPHGPSDPAPPPGRACEGTPSGIASTAHAQL